MRRFASLIAALTLAVPMVVSPVAAPTVAAASDPNGISFTLEGCNLDHGGTYDQLTNTCSDSAYTTGNLGKSWAELDLVPLRFTVASGNSPNQTYSFVVGGDYLNGAATHNGWDYIGPDNPVLDTSLSDAACTDASFDTLTITPPGAGVGGAYQTIYRLVTLTQQTGTTCVYDYYMRLALGAHLFSGSSLQAHLWNQSLNSSGIGEKRVQLPVSQLLPPTISKDMAASQGEDNVWTLVKSPNPASLDFGNVCAANAPTSKPVTVTVTWTKTAGTLGLITVVTNVYGTNVAHRDLTLTATDVIMSGTTVLDTVTGIPTVVPANTANVLLLTHTITVAADKVDLNDSATATVTDPLTGVPILGTIGPATASAVPDVTGKNDTATITDRESITGSGLAFSVATPSVGAFTDYTAGTSTIGPVDWSSGTQSASGSVAFSKTVTLSPLQVTSGTLSDTATLNGSDGFTVDATADIAITSTAAGVLTINKTIPNILQGDETQTFDFVVTDDSTDATTGTSITFAAGEFSKHVDVPDLSPGDYTVHENTATGWNPQGDQRVTIALCSGSATFENTFAPASASAVKVTVPAGGQAGWSMTLAWSGGSETVLTNVSGNALFTTTLADGVAYTITEVAKTGWDQTSATGDCSFTVDYPADFGTTFTCTFNNTERGNIALIKTFQGGAIPAGDSFRFQVRQNATSVSDGTVLSTVDVTSGTTFPVNLIAPNSLVPGTYQVCELMPGPGWGSTITTMTGHFELNGGVSGYFCVPVTVTAGQTTTLTIDNTPPPGGVALTIGYWKTHSCQAPGKQADVLWATLNGHGFLVGNLLVDTCNEAVSLLSKTPIGATKNAASDPAFNFAAQYVAYKLNLLAGAANKTAAANAAANGQSILVAISFNGVTHTGISPAQKSALLADASILDKYNNNSL